MHTQTGWSIAAITGAYSLAVLVSGLASIRIGRALDHHSPRLLMTVGSILGALLVLAWSRVGSLVELYVVFAGLGIVMALVLYEPAFVVVTKWFHHRRTAALTTLTLIAAVSSFVFSPLTEWLQASYGWRDAVALLALILAAITIPLHALVLRPAQPPVDPLRIRSTPTTRRMVIGRLSFWLIVASFALTSFVSVAVIVHLVAILRDGGSGASFAAFAAGLMGISQIPGRIVFALAGSRLGAPAAAASVFSLAAAALALLSVEQSHWAMLVFVLCFGMSNGMATLLRATLIADLYGRERFGSILGLVSGFALAAEAAAPLGAALIALAPGGYTTLVAVLATLAAAAALAAGRGIRLEQTPRPTTDTS
jgi:MFS family permease